MLSIYCFHHEIVQSRIRHAIIGNNTIVPLLTGCNGEAKVENGQAKKEGLIMTASTRIWLICGLSALLLLALIALIVFFPVSEQVGAAVPDVLPAYADELKTTVPQGDSVSFLLRDLNGQLAVYRLPEISVPDMITDIDTIRLRQRDYQSLQTGIRVEGWENLQKALEDFGP